MGKISSILEHIFGQKFAIYGIIYIGDKNEDGLYRINRYKNK